MYMAYEIFIFVFIILSFFFSSAETAIISANVIKLRSLADQGDKRARRAVAIINDVENSIGMVLIGNNIVNIASASFITFIAAKHVVLSDANIFVITALQTIVFLVLCEIVPKIIARDRADTILMMYSTPIALLNRILLPVTKFSLVITSFIQKAFGISESENSFIRSRDEIETLFQMGKIEGVIKKRHQDFIDEILNLREITVREIMTPTIDMVAVEKDESVRKTVGIIGKTRFSRIPVYEDRVDNIIGYVYYRDFLGGETVKKIEDILRKPSFVPSTKNIDELFVEMRKNGARILFVVNEYGGVDGLVTSEDIVEELVGEIQTRDHPKKDLIKMVRKRKYLVSGETDIEFFQNKFGMKIEKKGFETLAGFITYHFGKIPSNGEKISIEGYTFIIHESTDKSVESVYVTVPVSYKAI